MSEARDVVVRRACLNDLEAALRLWDMLDTAQAGLDPTLAPVDDAHALRRAEFSDLVREDGGLYVAEAGGRVVGLMTVRLLDPPPLYEPQPYAFIDELVVDPAWRRQGVAARLVDVARDWARAQGAVSVEARMVAANAEARAFWAQQGAEDVAVTIRLSV